MASFLIFLRESLEASMICSILFAYLAARQQLYRHKAMWLGIIGGILASLCGGTIVYLTVQQYEGTMLQTVIEGITYFVACAIVTYMTLWMRKIDQPNAQLSTKIEGVVENRSTLAVAIFIFLTITREGLEGVVFMIPMLMVSNPLGNVLGALLGILVGGYSGYAIYALGKKVSIDRLLRALQAVLVLFGAGLLVNGIGMLQELGWITVGKQVLWDTSGFLSVGQPVGDLLHAFVGYTQSPTLLQALFYLGYLAFILGWFRTHKK
jgi:high-affinity iron transporter